MRRPGTIPKPPDPKCTEREFQTWVKRVAVENGWKYSHTYKAQMRDGAWRTTAATGFPDLVLVRDGVLVFAELKDHRGKVDSTQDEWLDTLAAVDGALVFVWRPSDWRDVVKVLVG